MNIIDQQNFDDLAGGEFILLQWALFQQAPQGKHLNSHFHGLVILNSLAPGRFEHNFR